MVLRACYVMSGTDVACTTMRVRGTSGTEACGTGVRFRTEEEKNNALVGELRTMEVPFRTTGLLLALLLY